MSVLTRYLSAALLSVAGLTHAAAPQRLQLMQSRLDADSISQHRTTKVSKLYSPINEHVLSGETWSRSDSHKIPLTDGRVDYFVMGTLGIPTQYFYFGLDLTTSNLWVASNKCGCQSCLDHSTYDASWSTTYKRNDTLFEGSHRFGAVYGYVSRDVFNVQDVTLAGQDFGEVLSELDKYWYVLEDSRFLEVDWDGIWGLGFASKAARGMLPPLYNMFNTGAIENLQFAILLTRDAQKSELHLGGYEKDSFTGKLHTLHIDQPDMWTVNFTSISMVDETVDIVASMTFDISSWFISFPGILADMINLEFGAKVDPEHGLYQIVDCKRVDSLPIMSIGLAGHNFDLGPEDYIWRDDDICRSLIVSDNARPTLGAPFLMRYYSVYDFQEGTISLAEAKVPK